MWTSYSYFLTTISAQLCHNQEEDPKPGVTELNGASSSVFLPALGVESVCHLGLGRLVAPLPRRHLLYAVSHQLYRTVIYCSVSSICVERCVTGDFNAFGPNDQDHRKPRGRAYAGRREEAAKQPTHTLVSRTFPGRTAPPGV